jgi:hypothetical protein
VALTLIVPESLKRQVWACDDCQIANSADNDVCEFCGGTTKIPLYPVRQVNQMQGTPSYDELTALLAKEEAERTV